MHNRIIIVIKVGKHPVLAKVSHNLKLTSVPLGSASLVDENTFRPKFSAFLAIAETVSQLRTAGHNVVLVSSGSMAIGRGLCGMGKKQVSKSTKKVGIPTKMFAAEVF